MGMEVAVPITHANAIIRNSVALLVNLCKGTVSTLKVLQMHISYFLLIVTASLDVLV